MGNKLKHQPWTDTEKRPPIRLDDFSEVTIGGVTYRARSVFADKGQMSDLLDLVTMEKIGRIA